MKTCQIKSDYTVVTGASTGLGKELAIAFARQQYNLILVALPGRNLPLFCKELEHLYGIRAVSFECDLTEEGQLKALVDTILKSFSVNRLINNAGIGGTKRFIDATPEYLEKLIHLNIRATTLLTRMLLPELMRHTDALIVNISSLAAFVPIPYKTIYPASKAFIYSFSRSLSKELKSSGVRVVVVNPGQIITNPNVTLRIITQGFLGKIGLLTCGEITRHILKDIDRGKEVVIPGLLNKINRFFMKCLPEQIRLSIMEKANRKELTIKSIFDQP